MRILPAASTDTDYHCYQFRAGALLRAISFADPESAKGMAVAGLSWSDCDRIELWHRQRKMLEMVCGASQMAILRTTHLPPH